MHLFKKYTFNWKKLKQNLKPFFWFLIGFFLSAFFLSGFILIYFQKAYANKVIPGIFIGNEYVGEKTQAEVKAIYDEKNRVIGKSSFSFTYQDMAATVSAAQLSMGYDSNLLAVQTIDLGKKGDIFSNIYMILNSYINGTYLQNSYTFNEDTLKRALKPITDSVYTEPKDALFTVANNRVVAFQESVNGKSVDIQKLQALMNQEGQKVARQKRASTIAIQIPIKVVKPQTTTEEANKFGIVEEIGVGHSQFQHSIPSRVHNVTLAASRVNGVLVPPGEEFSFDKNLGDVSKYTGYQEAYVIQNGRTVLGDGGGVCQVSTTLFRAILNAGLPITERHAHSYRVGYYEQDSPPGLDATTFVPTVDLKFKNDTKNYILITSYVDPTNLTLSFTLYGKKDGRQVNVTTPIITSQTPPGDPVYQDDPTLPKGQEKQVESPVWGATVTFSRTVTKDGKKIIDEDFNTRYVPWKAVFLRGTKEG